jgi:ketosteroid isomerase-like protein
MPAENVEIVRRIYDGWARGDPPWADDVFDLYDPDVTWDMPHPGLTANNRDELFAVLRRFLGTWEEYQVRVDEMRVLPDGRVLVLFSEHTRGRGAGIASDVEAAAVWRLGEGRVVAYRAYVRRADAFEALGLSE